MGKKDNGPLGLYIHIPFCHARCGYCDFVTFTGKDDQRDAYIQTLCKEIDLYPEANIATVFLGGGTPSVLDPLQIRPLFQAIRNRFKLDPTAEITLEANPESVTLEKLDAWREAGINRLSFGLQAYDDTLLQIPGKGRSFPPRRSSPSTSPCMHWLSKSTRRMAPRASRSMLIFRPRCMRLRDRISRAKALSSTRYPILPDPGWPAVIISSTGEDRII